MRLELIGLTLVLMVPSAVIGSMLLHGIAADWRYTAGERAGLQGIRALSAHPSTAWTPCWPNARTSCCATAYWSWSPASWVSGC
ncbi:hypothetical protein [Tepidimonas sp.]|uniref:hypothetical protein n=1 Tax=Tepidimonas sp. TaxID=2002775 RepID=UPI002FE2300C